MIGPRGGRARRARRQEGGGLAAAGTLLVHVVVAGVLLSKPGAREPIGPVYHVELVAAPAPRPEERRAPEVMQRPAETTPAVPTARQPRRPTVSPEKPPEEAQPEVEREPAPRTTPTEGPASGVEPSTGTDPGTVRVEGIPFPYPEYLRNIVAEVYRRWHRPVGEAPLQAEVQFIIRRDGAVIGLQFIKRSGSFAFDLEAEGAIEAAGNARAFGPLPAGYAADVLPVSFFFNPRSLR